MNIGPLACVDADFVCGSFTLTVTVSREIPGDICESTCTKTVFLVDDEAPVLIGCPLVENLTIDCGDPIPDPETAARLAADAAGAGGDAQ